MNEPKKCEVCAGEGTYPIIDSHGTERYSISCPECYGSGEEYTEPEPEPADLPPASSAAFIKSPEQLREHIRQHWSPQDTSHD